MNHHADFTIQGAGVTVNAQIIARGPTVDSLAWRGPYHTVQLLAPLDAFRLHGAGANYDSPEGDGSKWVSSRGGSWYALGDIIMNVGEWHRTASLPHSFSFFTAYQIPEGAVLNVGVASNRFHDRPGGIAQAEFFIGNNVIALGADENDAMLSPFFTEEMH